MALSERTGREKNYDDAVEFAQQIRSMAIRTADQIYGEMINKAMNYYLNSGEE